MREIEPHPPRRSEILSERRPRERPAQRENMINFDEKEDIYRMKNRRLIEHQKKFLKSAMENQAKILRKDAAHGINGVQRNEEPTEDFYLKATPLNVCNICGRILNSKRGKDAHVKDTPSHALYVLSCPEDRCGGLFLNRYDLEQHLKITNHS